MEGATSKANALTTEPPLLYGLHIIPKRVAPSMFKSRPRTTFIILLHVVMVAYGQVKHREVLGLVLWRIQSLDTNFSLEMSVP